MTGTGLALVSAACLATACQSRVHHLGQESDPDDPGPLAIAPALCTPAAGGAPRPCAGTIRWWFTLGDARDDAVNGLALDPDGGVFFAAALANDQRHDWRRQAYVGSLSATGQVRWSAPLSHRNRNWADTAVAVLAHGQGGLLVAGHHGINGHQYVPYLDELAAGAPTLLRKLTLLGSPDCPVYPCERSGGQELAAIARSPDGSVWIAGVLKGEPDVPLPWLIRPTSGREEGHGLLVAVAGGTEPIMGRSFGDLRIERMTGVAPLAGRDAVAVGIGRPTDRVDPRAPDELTLLRIGADGQLRWSRSLRATGAVWSPHAAGGAADRTHVTFGFAGSVDLGGRSLQASSAGDTALVAFDGDGQVVWAASWPQGARGLGTVVTADGGAGVLVASEIAASVRAGGIVPSSGPGAFIGRFTSGGVHRSSTAFASGARFDPRALVTTPGGGVIVGGAFEGPLTVPGRELARAVAGMDAVVLEVTGP